MDRKTIHLFPLVTRMGFEPMNTTLRGWRVQPLHQRVIFEQQY